MNCLQVRPLPPTSDALAVLSVSGELDLHSRTVLDAAITLLTDAAHTKIVLDCGHLTYCDSVGLHCLLGWHQHLEKAGGTLVLADLTPAIASLLRITGTDQVFSLANTLDQARQLLLPPPTPQGTSTIS